MADEIASAMEQEMVEEQAIKCPRPSAKRQRKGSPDAREETDKERVDDSLLQDARRIKENIRVYMNATDRNVSAKVQKHVNGKIQQLIDIMETIYDKNYEKTFLVQRVVKDTLASSEMYDIIVNALVEKAVPMVIEGIKTESKTIQRPLSEPQTSREFPCVKEQPLLADALIETTENESFQEADVGAPGTPNTPAPNGTASTCSFITQSPFLFSLPRGGLQSFNDQSTILENKFMCIVF
ncbi:unnamed protein product [Nezara viridula]|uniref:Uncharacterized protein n=1 Tax=Nezara viridula TaxID=85310 RepID=A0A9P0E2B3_NEZVI|nr:unnamed protein product [Nezara viridula]